MLDFDPQYLETFKTVTEKGNRHTLKRNVIGGKIRETLILQPFGQTELICSD